MRVISVLGVVAKQCRDHFECSRKLFDDDMHSDAQYKKDAQKQGFDAVAAYCARFRDMAANPGTDSAVFSQYMRTGETCQSYDDLLGDPKDIAVDFRDGKPVFHSEYWETSYAGFQQDLEGIVLETLPQLTSEQLNEFLAMGDDDRYDHYCNHHFVFLALKNFNDTAPTQVLHAPKEDLNKFLMALRLFSTGATALTSGYDSAPEEWLYLSAAIERAGPKRKSCDLEEDSSDDDEEDNKPIVFPKKRTKLE